MKIKVLKETPRNIKEFPVENEYNLSKEEVTDIAEIFSTPLTGSYNWDYTVQDNRIKRLYELGKDLNWNAEKDIDWDRPLPERGDTPPPIFWDDYEPYQKLSTEDKFTFMSHRGAWSLSQFLHGEQGALLVASQLVSCAPTFNAKLYAASQTFDAFNLARQGTFDPVFKDMLYLIIRDEARHVTFGVNYLEEFVKTLSDEEREERAKFAYEACVVMRGRLMSSEVYEHFGWDVEDAVAFQSKSDVTNNFQHLLFTRVVPNLARIGLLTDKVKPLYDELGVLDYQDWPTDGEIDWASLSRPLDQSEEVEEGQFISI